MKSYRQFIHDVEQHSYNSPELDENIITHLVDKVKGVINPKKPSFMDSIKAADYKPAYNTNRKAPIFNTPQANPAAKRLPPGNSSYNYDRIKRTSVSI